MSREFGDFQTPIELCRQVVALFEGCSFERVLEPTCGAGSFLEASHEAWPRAERIGIEIQQPYLEEARRTGAEVLHASLFDINLSSDLPWTTANGRLIAIGNPPWVTNAELGALGSINLPKKSNVKGLKGLDAITGASNFDITEYMLIKLIVELMSERPVVAMLCKTQVARNVFEYCRAHDLPVGDFEIFTIDAKKWFDAAVDACLFKFSVGSDAGAECAVRVGLSREHAPLLLGYNGRGQLVTDLAAYEEVSEVDGLCPLEWRQGLKHDASAVMELVTADGSLQTKSGEIVSVEEEFVFPLLKCTDLHRDRLSPRRAVVVPQKAFGEETKARRNDAPALWDYLEANADALDGRKSSIYKGKPRFSVFGLGPYSFAPWKVAVSGLHADPNFRLVGPYEGRPVFFDDTCYLLPFEDEASACIAFSILTSPVVSRFLSATKYPGAKRPITKKLLQRIDLRAAIELSDRRLLLETAQRQVTNDRLLRDSDLDLFAREDDAQGVLAL
ncbi:MAG: SAM-dependent methyltransferase [Actinomycetota bacterium]